MSAHHHCTTGRRRGRYGFTLIELLVVVSIIALLISILVPSLAGAREQAKVLKCASQLRQLGTATRYYSADNKGWIPGNYYPAGHNGVGLETPHVLAAEVLARYVGGENQSPSGTQGVADRSRDCALAQMFVRMPIFQCPSWPGGQDGDPNPCGTSGGQSRRRGGGEAGGGASGPQPVAITGQVLCYSVNAWDWFTEKRSLGPDGFYTGSDSPGAYGIRKSERVPRPAEVIFMTETNRDNIGWKSYVWHDIFLKAHLWDSVDARMVDDLRHRAGTGGGVNRAVTNNLYYDGHVQAVRVVTIRAHDFSPYQRPPGVPAVGGSVERRR